MNYGWLIAFQPGSEVREVVLLMESHRGIFLLLGYHPVYPWTCGSVRQNHVRHERKKITNAQNKLVHLSMLIVSMLHDQPQLFLSCLEKYYVQYIVMAEIHDRSWALGFQ